MKSPPLEWRLKHAVVYIEPSTWRHDKAHFPQEIGTVWDKYGHLIRLLGLVLCAALPDRQIPHATHARFVTRATRALPFVARLSGRCDLSVLKLQYVTSVITR